VNDSPYGLQAGVFTHDARRIQEAFRHIETGGVIVNDIPTLRLDHLPYGGVKSSGLGREGVDEAMREMSERAP
jgi:acyl-CoA reductase-like NAD-dependent aldehyde dehydrogenase